MPPESLYGSYKPASTTVWQIGVVLYETLHRGDKFETLGFLQNKFRIRRGLSRSTEFTATGSLSLTLSVRSFMRFLIMIVVFHRLPEIPETLFGKKT